MFDHVHLFPTTALLHRPSELNVSNDPPTSHSLFNSLLQAAASHSFDSKSCCLACCEIVFTVCVQYLLA